MNRQTYFNYFIAGFIITTFIRFGLCEAKINNIQSHICSLDEIIVQQPIISPLEQKIDCTSLQNEIDSMKLQIENLKSEDDWMRIRYQDLCEILLKGGG